MSKYAGSTNLHLIYCELIQAARYRGLTTYQTIARIGGLPQQGNAMSAATGAVLGLIVQQEQAEGRPMLSAVCVGVSGKPGEGFYNYAEELGLFVGGDKEEREEFWQKQLSAVYEAWKPK